MAKNHVPVPKTEDPGQWLLFINTEIPLIDNTSDERGLNRLRNRVAQAVARREAPSHAVPRNLASYEGNMGDFAQYAFEHKPD